MIDRRFPLIKEEKRILDFLYWDYQNHFDISLKDLAGVTNLDRTTIGKYYRNKFGEEYLELAKLRNKIKRSLSEETKHKISVKLKGKKKPQRTKEHRYRLSLAFKGVDYKERFGNKAELIKEKIRKANKGKKRLPRSDIWKLNLSSSLKGRSVWNKGKKGFQVAWNKKQLPEDKVVDLYTTDQKSSKQIATMFNVSKSVILEILKKRHIPRKTSKDFITGKKLEEIHGEEKAREIRKKLSEKANSREITWRHKLSEGLRNYHKYNVVSNERRFKQSEISKKLWSNREYRKKQVEKHKEYLRNNPQELERLKNIQPNKITKIEQKMLDFLKEYFIEGDDFYFDKREITGKTLYRPDFQFPAQKIIIELYGYYKHFTKEGKQKDKIREYYLKKAGWKVYKFNHLEIERGYLFTETKQKVLSIIKNG